MDFPNIKLSLCQIGYFLENKYFVNPEAATVCIIDNNSIFVCYAARRQSVMQ